MRALSVNEIKRERSVGNAISVGKRQLIIDWLIFLGLDPRKANIEDGVVDYDGSVRVIERGLKTLTNGLFRFGKINGTFVCENNHLRSLAGAPEEVADYFICDHNNLSSLEFGPKKVGGTFSCGYNKLTSLIHGPTEVGIDYQCEYNLLENLVGMPDHNVYGTLWCQGNKLKSLEGCPSYILASFYCHHNDLKNLNGGPSFVGESYDCSNNPVKFTEDYVRQRCKVTSEIIT